MIDFSKIEQYRENNRIEAKKALGGLPKSIWETYSAFANTYGGIILLGVEELEDKSFRTVDLPDPEKLIKEFWDIVNNPTQISTSGRQFMADNSNRESARWAEALDRLVEWGWVKAVGYKGELFELTGTGYCKADWLKAGMEIDTSKDPLDELKEFEG